MTAAVTKLTAVFIFVNICRDKFECCPGEFSGFPKEFSLCVGVDCIAGHLTVGNRIADGDLYIGDRVVLSVYHFPFDLVVSMWAAVFFYLTSPSSSESEQEKPSKVSKPANTQFILFKK